MKVKILLILLTVLVLGGIADASAVNLFEPSEPFISDGDASCAIGGGHGETCYCDRLINHSEFFAKLGAEATCREEEKDYVRVSDWEHSCHIEILDILTATASAYFQCVRKGEKQ